MKAATASPPCCRSIMVRTVKCSPSMIGPAPPAEFAALANVPESPNSVAAAITARAAAKHNDVIFIGLPLPRQLIRLETRRSSLLPRLSLSFSEDSADQPSAMTHRVWAIFVEAHGQDKIRGMSLDAPSALMLQSRRHEFTVNSERHFPCPRKRSPLVSFARRLTVLIDELTGRSYWARYHDCQREDGRRLRRIGAAPPRPTAR